MKIKILAILLFFFLSGCGLFGNSPTSVVSQFQKLAEKEQNIEAMEKLFSERAKRDLGAERVLIDILSAVDFGTKVAATGESMPFLKPEETINGEFATVTFYMIPTFADKNDVNNQAKVLLVKENGEWKIYAFGQKGEPQPNPVANSFHASQLYSSFLSQPTLLNKRLTGKIVVVKGYFLDTDAPDEKDTISAIKLKNTFNDSTQADGSIVCKFPDGARQPYAVTEKMSKAEVKIKGTVTAKDKSTTAVILENCTIE